MLTIRAYDPLDPAVRADPYPVLDRLRREEPVHWSPSVKAWILTRYDDVRTAHNDPAFSPDRLTPFFDSLTDERRAGISDLIRYLNLWLVFRDPPEHTRLRMLMTKAFTPRAILALEPRVAEIANMLADDLAVRGEADFVDAFAMKLPAFVILEMLGLPRDRFEDIKTWSDEMNLFIGTARNVPGKYERAERGAHALAGFFRTAIEARRREPGNDILSALITAQEDSDALSDDELVATCMLFLFAGHETTTNLLATALEKFSRHPDAWAALRADKKLIDSAVEECLRLDGPSHASARVVAVEHVLHGQTMAAGDRVFAMVNAANRDEAVFHDPASFDITRQPNRHLSFGFGPHFCMGAVLARLEARVALRILSERFEKVEPSTTQAPEWLDALIMRGLKKLPLRFY